MRKLFVILMSLMLTISVYGSSNSSSKKSYSSGSGKSYSSSKSSGSSSKSYSSGSKSYSSGSSSSDSGSKPKSSFSFFGRAEKAQAKADSKSKYEQFKDSVRPKTDGYKYRASSFGGFKKESYSATRENRERTTFGNYYNAPQQPTRDSSFNPFFWLWLLDHKDSQAEWVYHHRKELSDERYKELLSKNTDLEKQLKEIENKKLAQDPNYAPTGVDKDLMYAAEEEGAGVGEVLLWGFFGTICTGLLSWGVWQVFFRKRNF